MTALRRLLSSWRARAALALALGYALLALVGPLLLDGHALALDPLHELESPSARFWFGRAENGVPVGAALVVGARTSLLISLVATVLSLVVGAVVGAASAVLGGKLDALALRVLDVLSAFPGILLAIYLAAVLPPSALTVVLALSVTGWVGFARVARTSVQQVLARDHVTAANALGVPRARVILTHVLPLALAPLVVQGSFALSTNILAEASLAFLGLGAPPGTPSWGSLLDEGVTYLFAAPHLALFPGVCVAAAVLAFHVLGDALLDALDVRSSSRLP
jgi:peptide/nickel transport system permease protein